MTTPDPPFVGARPWLSAVVAWAAAVHAEQFREVDNAPFVLHPLEVASTLSSRGYDDAVVAAGLLHDAVEKTETTIEAVRERCGDRVAAIVAAVTEDDTITDYAERKSKLRAQMAAAGVDAHAVYAADKLTKARELRAQVARDRQAVDGSGVSPAAGPLRGQPRASAQRRRGGADGRTARLRAVGVAGAPTRAVTGR